MMRLIGVKTERIAPTKAANIPPAMTAPIPITAPCNIAKFSFIKMIAELIVSSKPPPDRPSSPGKRKDKIACPKLIALPTILSRSSVISGVIPSASAKPATPPT